MVIQNLSNRVQYDGDGLLSSFHFPYKFYEAEHIRVVLTDINPTTLEETETDLVNGTDFNLTLEELPDFNITYFNGGEVVLGSPLTTDQRLTILREMPIVQLTDYVANHRFHAETIEKDYDYRCMIEQQLLSNLDRCFRIAETATGLSVIFPQPEPNKYLAWNGTGDGLVNTEVLLEFTASDIDFVPAGTLEATNVQTAIEELDAEKQRRTHMGNGTPVAIFAPEAQGDFYYDFVAQELFIASDNTSAGWELVTGDALTFSNGLTRTGDSVTLGGTLTENTDIDTNGSTFALSGEGRKTISTAGAVGDGTKQFSIAPDHISLTSDNGSDENVGITFTSANGVVLLDEIFARGINTHTRYHDNYEKRTLVDREYMQKPIVHLDATSGTATIPETGVNKYYYVQANGVGTTDVILPTINTDVSEMHGSTVMIERGVSGQGVYIKSAGDVGLGVDGSTGQLLENAYEHIIFKLDATVGANGTWQIIQDTRNKVDKKEWDSGLNELDIYDNTKIWEFTGIADTVLHLWSQGSELIDGQIYKFYNTSEDTIYLEMDGHTGLFLDGNRRERVISAGGFIWLAFLNNNLYTVNSQYVTLTTLPSDIAWLEFWLDASDRGHTNQVGGVVSSWEDKSSNNRIFTAVGGEEPTEVLNAQNDLPVIRFDGTDDALSMGDIEVHSNTPGRGMSIMAVIKSNVSDGMLVSKYSTTGDNRSWLLKNNTAFVSPDGTYSSSWERSFSATNGEFYILELVWTPSEKRYRVYKNGTEVAVSSNNIISIPDLDSDVMIGKSGFASHTLFSGDIAEISCWSIPVTDIDREALRQSHAIKWSIAGIAIGDTPPIWQRTGQTITPVGSGDALELNGLLRINNKAIIGTGTPTAVSATLNITGTDGGFTMPRLTEVQRDALPIVEAGLEVYNTTTGTFNHYNGTAWVESDTTLPHNHNLVDLTEKDYSSLTNKPSLAPYDAHIGTVTGNPHDVTATDVGLGNVDNTSDANKPISTDQQTALDAKVAILDIVDNVSSTDTDKPLSANQGKLLNDAIVGLQASLSPQGAWDADTNTPDITTTTETGYYWIVSVDGATDLGGITDWVTNDWAVKTATGWAKVDNTDSGGGSAHTHSNKTELDLVLDGGHYAKTTNPHSVTATQVGLGNVDNTSDVNKPISTAQQTALNAKVATTDIVDNVTSTDTTAPLSANQGRVLKNLISGGGGSGRTLLSTTTIDAMTIVDSSASGHILRPTHNTAGLARAVFHNGDHNAPTGGTCLTFNLDNALAVDTHADFDFGTGDFVVETYFKPNVTNSEDGIFDLRQNTNRHLDVRIYGGTLDISVNGGYLATHPPMVVDTWYHLALVRSGDTFYAYLDGALIDSKDVTGVSFTDDGNGIWVGKYYSTSQHFNGDLDEFRISKGTDRGYVGGFTPSTSPFTPDGNTVLLIQSDVSNPALSLLEFTGMDNTYSEYELVGTSLCCNNYGDMLLRLSGDNGATFYNTDYSWHTDNQNNALSSLYNNSDTKMELFYAEVPSYGDGYLSLRLYDPCVDDGHKKQIAWEGQCKITTTYRNQTVRGSGQYMGDDNIINAFQISGDVGYNNYIIYGRFNLYGII